jgi:hypothetical protein
MSFLRRKPTLDEQISVLARCGIAPKPGVSIEALGIPHQPIPYELLLVVLGAHAETPPFSPHSDNIWHLDFECIEGPGSYVRVANRMETLAGGELELRNVEDFIDPHNGKASLSFTSDGENVSWPIKVKDDWLDGDVLSKFAQLLEAKQASKRFTYCSFEGQDCLIGCSTPEQLALLRKETGLKFKWLD